VDLNHIFLFLAVVSPLLLLARAWRPGGAYRGWRVAALIVLATTGVAWILVRPVAGYIGGATWIALLFLPAIGLRKMTKLAARENYKAARKLATTLQILHPTAELHEEIRVLRRLEAHQHPQVFRSNSIGHKVPQQETRREFRRAPAVLILIFLNAVAFLFETSFGSSNDPDVLHRLGALEPHAVLVQGEYWRLFTALFLHAGLLHLLFNLFALYILGPPLERSIGPVRFTMCYLISGFASSCGVVLLTVIRVVQVGQLVGASGCIMGIVGAWAGFLVMHWHIPHAKQRLVNVFMIIAIQTAFDLSTPEVSMTAHLCGLIAGFVLGLILSPQTVAAGLRSPSQE